MKKLCIVLALLLALLMGCAGAETEDFSAWLPDGSCDTLDQLFDAGEQALEAGMDPETVGREMYRLAEANGFPNEFLYTVENIAGYQNSTHKTFSNELGFGLFTWHDLRLNLSQSSRALNESLGWDAYAVRNCSKKMKEVFADADAQYCITPCYWWSCFEELTGVTFQKFVPLRSRPGYACVVQNQEGVDATFVNQIPQIMKKNLDHLTETLGDCAPVFTGNPHLASTFWNITLDTPFYAFYGKTRSVSGFDVVLTLEVIDAKTHKTIAKIQERSRLPRTIPKPAGDAAYADVPVLQNSSKYDSFVKKVRAEMEKEWKKAEENQRVTSLSVEGVLRKTLLQQSETLKDPWLTAIYTAGPEDIKLAENEVVFQMRDYAFPGLTLAESDSAETWLRDTVRQALDSQVEVRVQVTDGELGTKSLTSLKTELGKKATQAQKKFGGKDFTSTLKQMLFPSPVSGKIKDATQLLEPDEAFTAWMDRHAGWMEGAPAAAWSALFYAQKSQTVSFRDGPENVAIECTGANPATLLEQAKQGVLKQLEKESDTQIRSKQEMEELFLSQLATAALKAHSSGKEKTRLTFGMADLLEDENLTDYLEYLSLFEYQSVLDQLCEEAQTSSEIV